MTTAAVCPDLVEPPAPLVCERGCGFANTEKWRHQVHTLTRACHGYPMVPKADRR